MSLSLALNNALSGLNVNQNALSVLSNNIANANTEGYSRQVVEQSQVILDGTGAGVRIDDIVRKVDKYLEKSIQRETSSVGATEVVVDFYERIQILIGQPGQQNTIDEQVQSFFNELQSLAEAPNQVSGKATVVDTADVMAREISGLASAFEELRYQADQDIQEAANAINIQLRRLDTINLSLERADALNTPKAGLLDERDLALEEVAKYLNVNTYIDDTGFVFVYTANGVPLVDNDIHEVFYQPISSVNDLIENAAVNPLQVRTLSSDGEQIRDPDVIIQSGVEGGVTTLLKGGEIYGLQQLRDELIPDILSQLDMLASRLRDEINKIHNDGSGFPAAEELTGTRLVQADQAYDWSGEVMIAALNTDGTPAGSTYSDEQYTGYRPLTMDLDFLDSGFGAGVPTMQTIVDEINNHFNAPPVKAQVSNLNNIQIVSDNATMPLGAPPTFSFDVDLENISATESDFWVTGVTVLDDTATDITNNAVTDTLPRVAVDFANAYSFTAGSSAVAINTAIPHGLNVGDRVFLENPFAVPTALGGGSVNEGNVSGYFEITAVTGTNQFEIQMSGVVAAATVTDAAPAAFDVLPPYYEIAAGEKERTRDSGIITTNLALNSTSNYYDIQVTVGVYDNDPNTLGDGIDTATLTYRVFNNTSSLLNDRYDVTNVTGTGQRVFPSTPHQYIFAKLVDENGVELPSDNGDYGNQEGYLQLVANPLNGQELTIAMDELDSKQEGVQTQTPLEDGTDRGFSHYFELNNFFVNNVSTTTGDQVDGSAINLAVVQQLLDNPALISTGDLQQSLQSSDPNDLPIYTVERFTGDNSVIQALAALGINQVSFDAAGGLPDNTLTFALYTGEILGFIATKAVTAENKLLDDETLLNGFITRADAISGVNLDEEMASTLIYQNAYAASARVITVTGEMFDELLNAV